MAEKVDEKKMRKELIRIYQKFLNESSREEAINESIAYDRRYGGLASEHYEKYVSADILDAIGGLSTIYQYGLYDDSHEAFSNEKILSAAKKILEELQKS